MTTSNLFRRNIGLIAGMISAVALTAAAMISSTAAGDVAIAPEFQRLKPVPGKSTDPNENRYFILPAAPCHPD